MLIILSCCFVAIAADVNPYAVYIENYSALAISEMQRTGVPASITLAQGLLESNAGRSAMAQKARNHFGIKCHRDWTGKTMNFKAETPSECFRVYPRVEDSFKDHSDFLRYQNRYKALFDLDKTDYKGWARGLKAAGYATDPKYPAKLIKLIEEYELYRFDSDVKIEVEAPSIVETPKPVTSYRTREIFRIQLTRKVFEQNGVPFVYAIEGDSYRSIAKLFGMFTDEILRDNDLSREVPLEGGEIVYLHLKKKQAAKSVNKFIVGPGEEVTLRDIAQRYGVRMSSLQTMNGCDASAEFREGDTILLRK